MPRADAQNISPVSDLTAPQIGKSTFAQVATQLNQISSDCSQVNDKMYKSAYQDKLCYEKTGV